MAGQATIWTAAGTMVAVVTSVVIGWGYRLERQRRRRDWAFRLFEIFFVQNGFKRVREILDSPPGAAEVAIIVGGEASEFTDYLNFFEFVAYLLESKELRESDFKALLGYYFDCLKRHTPIRAYIEDKGKSFEHLDQRLKNSGDGTTG